MAVATTHASLFSLATVQWQDIYSFASWEEKLVNLILSELVISLEFLILVKIYKLLIYFMQIIRNIFGLGSTFQ